MLCTTSAIHQYIHPQQHYDHCFALRLEYTTRLLKSEQIFKTLTLLKKTIESCPKHNRKCNGFNGYNGNCIGFKGNYNGVYWYVMDSIGGMLNPIGKMPKTHYKKEFCNGFTGKS